MFPVQIFLLRIIRIKNCCLGVPSARLTWEESSMTLFRLDASINPANSSSRAIADIVEGEWQAANPGGVVARKDLGTEPLPSTAWTGAVGASATPEEARTEEQRAALALAVGLAGELRSADAALLAVPLYNYGIPQHVKTWIDLVMAGAETAVEPLLAGKPAVLVVVRGGAYGPGTPRDGWDHSTAYLRRIIADVWGADLTVVEREFTLVGMVPALDDFTDLAAEFKEAAHAAAATAGKALAAA
jgi:FMN-dependent NADH-azoreductase